MSVIQGVLSLTDTSDVPILDFLNPIEGQHLPKKSSDGFVSGHFLMEASDGVETLWVPSRYEKIQSIISGYIDHPQGLAYALRKMLSLNADPNLKLVDLVSNMYRDTIKGTYCLVFSHISQSGKSSRFVFITRNRTLFLLGVSVGKNFYLVWSNDPEVEEKISSKFPEALFYRMKPLHDSICVIQTLYLVGRIRRWQTEGLDKLKIFAALEQHIKKSTRTA